MSLTHLSNLRLLDHPDITSELWIEDGYFVEPPTDTLRSETEIEHRDMDNALILPGLIETHIHLDKACIMDRCHLQHGTLEEAIALTSQAKQGFSEADIYQRGAQVIERAITQGTTHMRTHVEIDPGIGLKGFEAIRRLQADYAWAVTLQICVFPQEGMLNKPGTETLLMQCLQQGAEVLGGCPYTDSDPTGQIERLFALAHQYDRDLDFHLDFDLMDDLTNLEKVIEQTHHYGWHGRVTLGHVTRLSAVSHTDLLGIAKKLATAGIQLTCLPATDLFLMGRQYDHLIPRGVSPIHILQQQGMCCSLSTNNVRNPFTPLGDASLLRIANLYANIAQLGTDIQLEQCLHWITKHSAQLLRLENYGLHPGCKADFIAVDSTDGPQTVAEIRHPLMGFKSGKQTFCRPAATLLKPAKQQSGA
ncbi:amidohydrolase [Pokkaliibacter plantistimulans]|uniref:Amidohydrolase n=1 Tax=Proteobacteria bacterium 228 TaxID=2083153 RepID=A0A2S5KL17_9PROT|nr:amidohydrolase family protein [Pokkaliibacter plantistimulans]PPC75521.1 amidohydrolase [Pokkaliibacter plantistimulans]